MADALQRESRRRDAERVAYNMTIDRIRKEREGFRLRVNELQAELEVEKEKNDEIARMWREEAREERILPKPVSAEEPGTGGKRKSCATGGAGEAASKAFKTFSTPTTRSALAAKDNQLNMPNTDSLLSK
ncbi:hypothetical protein QFC20_006625 [Naganishia adeliensis]|uniref:Uncharacterized protein n=1 Tax=Naganishia adeliensis TaxID=92952 RepID=A0ACC2V8Y1_9TREE|nr:hypothetical protein QFC20_006625 [Naganishia adeliensis]